MNYRFTWPCPVFYPDVRDAEGKSLMALPGVVVDFPQGPPDDGKWVLDEDAPESTPAVPEPVQEAPEHVPAPVVTQPVPEPAQAITEPPEPDPATGPEPVPPAPETPAPYRFPGFVSPYART